jgi:hypothetical protein
MSRHRVLVSITAQHWPYVGAQVCTPKNKQPYRGICVATRQSATAGLMWNLDDA